MAQKVEALDQRRYRRQTKQGGCRPVIYIDIYWTTTHSAQEVGRRIKWVSMIRKERRCHLKSVPTATNWIRTMKNVGFVEETEGDNSGKAKVYKVVEPKIRYMLEHELGYLG